MNKTAEYFERLGRKFWFKGDYYKALEILRAGLGLYPRDAKLRLGIAMAQLRLGSYAVARELLSEILAVNPENGDAQMAYCEAALHLGRKQEAVDQAHRLAARHASSAALMEHVGTLFLQHGVFDQAAYFLKKSLAAEKSRPYALLGLGIANKGLGRDAEAVRVLREALKNSPKFYEAMSYLGNIIYDSGKRKDAIKLFLKIPASEQLDPVTLTRLIDFARRDRKLSKKVPVYEARLRELTTTYDIKNFIRVLEQKAGRKPAGRQPGPEETYTYVKVSGEQLPPGSGTRLKQLDLLLKLIFGARKTPSGLSRLTNPADLQPRAVASFFEGFAEYLKSGVQAAPRDPQHWLRSGGFTSLAPYAVAMIRAAYERQAELGLRQAAADSMMESLLNLLKTVPAGTKGMEWVTELGGVIIGFWSGADMLERALLLSEILPPAARKSSAALIARGRAWRRWLGFKAEPGFAHPSSKILPPGAASSGRSVNCARCGRQIRDYGYISQADDSPGVLCGDCAPLRYCPGCGGPLRQVSAGGGGRLPVYACMECLKRHQLPRRR
ncbi:MAG: tetratricopeptide repeat protein [Elusimicrobia bacterium]|nr:tetratricopeptide repeat protein [Elusimicrobiota bacterium]